MSPLMLIVLFAGACAAAPRPREGASGRIVGGTPVDIEKYPFMVQMEAFRSNRWGHSCGANIINNFFGLSAAHCTSRITDILYRPDRRRLRAGTHTREEGGVVHPVAAVLNHDTFRPLFTGNIDGDICLMRVETPFTWTDSIRPIPIPPQDWVLPDHTPVRHVGWGRVISGGDPSPHLLEVEIFSINHETCRNNYANAPITQRGNVTDNMICAGLLGVGGAGACQGDSGGPVYLGGIVIGITSWGADCAHPTLPTVSTRVSAYTDWITETAQW